ncbi:MAG: hypothetical protein ACKPGI_19255, partial [Verrucomicrobiota bacterium]
MNTPDTKIRRDPAMRNRNAEEGALFIGDGRQWLWTLGVWLAIAVFYLATARPYFGPNSDAVVYFAGARSFAEGHGYRFTILPGMPPIGLYPPGVSLMFTPIAWLCPNADSQAMGCLILLVAVTLLGVRVAFDILCRLGVPNGLAALATLSLATSPHWFLSVASLGSDTPFAVLAWVGGWWWLRKQQSMTLRGLVPAVVVLFLERIKGQVIRLLPRGPISIRCAWRTCEGERDQPTRQRITARLPGLLPPRGFRWGPE